MKTLLGVILIVVTASTSAALTDSQQPRAFFVDIKSQVDSVHYDIRYFTENNFVGQPIDGYLAPKCLLHKSAIADFEKAAKAFEVLGYRIKLFDCYRPEKAVAHFMRWAQDLNDTKTKPQYYPNLPKSALVGPYIAEKSGHSKGFTVDLTLQQQDAKGQWHDVDMGSPYDLFDPVSNTDNTTITREQSENRQLLKRVLQAHGFSAYDMEWWHFSFTKVEKYKRSQAFNFDVR